MSESVGLLERIHRYRDSNRFLFTTMLISACISMYASFVLSIDAVKLAANPFQELSCSINEVINCATVAKSWQASLFGFPNAFLGLIAESVVITVAVASLAGVKFPRGFMLAAQIVYTLGFVFASWLFYQSAFVIGALCPWCLLVTVSTTGVFASLTHVNIRDGNLFLPPRIQRAAEQGIRMGIDLLVVTLWLAITASIVVIKYGNTLIT